MLTPTSAIMGTGLGSDWLRTATSLVTPATRGKLADYIRLVKNASEGCVTDE